MPPIPWKPAAAVLELAEAAQRQGYIAHPLPPASGYLRLTYGGAVRPITVLLANRQFIVNRVHVIPFARTLPGGVERTNDVRFPYSAVDPMETLKALKAWADGR